MPDLPRDTSCPVPVRSDSGGLTDCDKPLYVTLSYCCSVDADPWTSVDYAHRNGALSWEIECENGHVVDSGGPEADGRDELIAYRSAQIIGGVR